VIIKAIAKILITIPLYILQLILCLLYEILDPLINGDLKNAVKAVIGSPLYILYYCVGCAIEVNEDFEKIYSQYASNISPLSFSMPMIVMAKATTEHRSAGQRGFNQTRDTGSGDDDGDGDGDHAHVVRLVEGLDAPAASKVKLVELLRELRDLEAEFYRIRDGHAGGAIHARSG